MSKAEVDPRGWPDYTYPMTIIGQELNVAIDIVAQSLPTLDINIAASATTLDVNITGSTVTLDVNIASQTANINIDIKAQSVAIKGLTDWAAETATDIDLTGYGECDSGITYTIISYTVPSGKKLLIYNWDAALGNGDGQIYCELADVTSGVSLGFGGGTRGFSAVLNKPARIASGHKVKVYVRQDTGASRGIFAHLGGVLL